MGAKSQIHTVLSVKLPTWLICATDAIREAMNAQLEVAQRMTMDEYVMWRLAEDITDEDMRELMDAVPGLSRAARQWAQHEAEKIESAHNQRLKDAGGKAASKLAKFMIERGIEGPQVYSTGVISRRHFYGLYHGVAKYPSLSTMIDVAYRLREITGENVEVADVFDLTVR